MPFELLLPISVLATLSMSALGCGQGLTRDLASQTGTSGCSPSQHFGAPAPVLGLGDGIPSARFSPDERTIYFAQSRGGQVDIYQASRPSRTEAFGPPTAQSTIDSAFEDDYPSVTADGSTLVFDSQRTGVYALYQSSRRGIGYAFLAPAPLAELNTADGGEGAPYLTPSGGALYFHSFRAGTSDLFRAPWISPTGFGSPERLSVVSTGATEHRPVVSPDELTIYFLSMDNVDRADGIWTASRASISAPFDNAFHLAELNVGNQPASPSWISPDGCRLYFDTADFHVYVAERD